MSTELDNLVSLIKSSKEFVLTTHIMPDGDGVGSQVALALALTRLGKKVWIVNSDEFPKVYRFLEYKDFLYECPEEIEVAIVLDCANLDRTGRLKEQIKEAKTIVKIDHHVSGGEFAHLNYVDVTAPATGALVWELIKKLDVKVSSGMATAIYTALVNDTGCFRYSNTDAAVLRLGADVLDAGADNDAVRTALFQSNSLGRIKIIANVYRNLEFFESGKLALGMVSQSEIIASNASLDDLEGVVDNVLAISGVLIGILLIEINNKLVKISVRSKTEFDVTQIVKEFGGGGHAKAAGAMADGSLIKIREEILSVAKNLLQSNG